MIMNKTILFNDKIAIPAVFPSVSSVGSLFLPLFTYEQSVPVHSGRHVQTSFLQYPFLLQ